MPDRLRPLLEYWFDAEKEPVGIILDSNNRQLLISRLYLARQEYQKQDPGAFSGISVCVSPTSDTEVWLVHKIVKVQDAEG